MTVITIDLRPDGEPAFAVTAELDGVKARFSMRWLSRIGRWACTLTAQDGTALAPQLIVQPSGRILADRRDPRVPPGLLQWLGPDDYRQEDLGGRLILQYVPA